MSFTAFSELEKIQSILDLRKFLVSNTPAQSPRGNEYVLAYAKSSATIKAEVRVLLSSSVWAENSDLVYTKLLPKLQGIEDR